MRRKSTIFFIIIALSLAFVLLILPEDLFLGEKIPYSQFVSMVEEGKVESITIYEERVKVRSEGEQRMVDSFLCDTEKKNEHRCSPSPITFTCSILVDGLPVKSLPNSTNVIKGDAKSLFIAAASILAKTARDEDCFRLEREYPGYGFAKHKGYPTPEHLKALVKRGPCPEHRRSFGPVSQLTLNFEP